MSILFNDTTSHNEEPSPSDENTELTLSDNADIKKTQSHNHNDKISPQ
jgi:hypothetical protein